MSSPFNQAWLVLKRQTALSEFEGFEELEDLPMPNQRQKIAVPTHINRIRGMGGGIDYNLMSGDTELGYISTGHGGTIEHYDGYMNPEYRRQGLYQKLLNALIQNNYKISSNNRNEKSHSAHKKFQENLPANVNFSEAGKEFDVSPLEQTFDYEKQPTEMIGGIQRYDYGSLPIRNEVHPEIIEYDSKPIHQRMTPKLSDPNNPYRQFMRLDEFSE